VCHARAAGSGRGRLRARVQRRPRAAVPAPALPRPALATLLVLLQAQDGGAPRGPRTPRSSTSRRAQGVLHRPALRLTPLVHPGAPPTPTSGTRPLPLEGHLGPPAPAWECSECCEEKAEASDAVPTAVSPERRPPGLGRVMAVAGGAPSSTPCPWPWGVVPSGAAGGATGAPRMVWCSAWMSSPHCRRPAPAEGMSTRNAVQEQVKGDRLGRSLAPPGITGHGPLGHEDSPLPRPDRGTARPSPVTGRHQKKGRGAVAGGQLRPASGTGNSQHYGGTAEGVIHSLHGVHRPGCGP